MTILANYFLHLFGQLGYTGIIILMAVESSLIPFPSELVMPPAGYLAAQGQFNLLGVIVAGTFGSLLGALFNYYLALYLGRALLYRFAETKLAKWFFITPAKITKAEQYFLNKGKLSTLIGRLIPAVRQLISLPAGLAKMNLVDFLIYTAVGAALWNAFLALAGYWLGASQALEQALTWLSAVGTQTLLWVCLFIFIYFLIWAIMEHSKRDQKAAKEKSGH